MRISLTFSHLIASCGLLLAILFGLPATLTAQPIAQEEAATTPAAFKVLSWNIYMLPRFAKVTGKRQRARAIARRLRDSDYQMLVLQEAFLGDARRILDKGLSGQFPHQFGPANRRFSIKTNSGIWILSKVPMRYLGEIDFTECAGFDDCMARKGALLVETEWNGQKVQVLGTHLQAGGPHSVRHSQYDELRALLDAHREPGIPQLICGDMNTGHSDTANYRRMLSVLDAEDGKPRMEEHELTEQGYPNDMHRRGFRNHRVIDYIFYRSNGRPARSIERSMPSIRFPWSKKHRDLSDHFPVTVEVVW